MQCDRSQKKKKKIQEGIWGQRSLEASVIRIIAMFLVLHSPSLALQSHTHHLSDLNLLTCNELFGERYFEVCRPVK